MLTDNEQVIADCSYPVEIQCSRIVGAIHQRNPAPAAVFSAENQIERADDISGFIIGEPNVQKRFVSPFIDHSLSLDQ
ncbi:hypothetical protein D9M71_720130 [compost metagenome]